MLSFQKLTENDMFFRSDNLRSCDCVMGFNRQWWSTVSLHWWQRMIIMENGNVAKGQALSFSEGNVSSDCLRRSLRQKSTWKKNRSRQQMREVSEEAGVGKPWKTFLILFWGHDLLLLPENIHLIKWNSSIWELFGQADFEVVQKTTKNKNLKPCIKMFLWEISCQSLPTKIINNGTFHFPMSYTT